MVINDGHNNVHEHIYMHACLQEMTMDHGSITALRAPAGVASMVAVAEEAVHEEMTMVRILTFLELEQLLA
jgi:hypothetical protein